MASSLAISLWWEIKEILSRKLFFSCFFSPVFATFSWLCLDNLCTEWADSSWGWGRLVPGSGLAARLVPYCPEWPAGLGCGERAPARAGAIYRLKIKLSVAKTTGSRLHHSGSSSGEICDIHINTHTLQHTPYPTAFKRYTLSYWKLLKTVNQMWLRNLTTWRQKS